MGVCARSSVSVSSRWLHGFAAMWLALSWASTTQAAPVTIDFEEFPDGEPTDGQTITTQYEGYGVRFSGGGTGEISNYGPLIMNYGLSFEDNLTIEFVTPASNVSLVVQETNNNGGTVTAYDENDEELQGFTLVLGGSVHSFPFEGIAKIEIATLSGENRNFIDNLTFSAEPPDMDGDGTPDDDDECDLDPAKTEAGVCGCGQPEDLTDTDEDGTPDCIDNCVNDPNKAEPGMCGCGEPEDLTDSDGDGTLDCNDDCPMDDMKTAPGVCGCGEADVDADSDETYTCQGDLCDNDAAKTEPGLCGCGVSDDDTDDDDTPDCDDECPFDPNKTSAGACGCGFSEDDSDSDGTPDCTDMCDNDPNKIAPGMCGCGAADEDLDMDTIVDCVDACFGNNATGDTDADGICNDRDDRVLVITEEFADARGSCPAGGVEITTGVDGDGDNALAGAEVYGTAYVCAGPEGPEGLQVRFLTALVAPDPDCPAGGVELKVGIDENRNGELDESIEPSDNEVDFTQKICHGLHSVVRLTPFEAGFPPAEVSSTVFCPTGGIHIAAGTDLNGNGELDDGEERVEQNICNGSNSLIVTADIAPGELCKTGGLSVRAGIDLDGDSALSGEELTSENTVCHGFNGIVTLSDLEPDPEMCPTGGVIVSSGTDRNADGEIDDSERSAEQSVCHGLRALIVTRSLEPGSEACPTGGTEIRTGIDNNGDGSLDDDEVESSQSVCAGLPSLSRSSAIDPNPAQCPFGGAKLETGVDDNGDGTLDDDEVDSTQVLCGGTGLAVRTNKLDVGSEACPAGGVQVETGIDVNGNGSLDDDEVQASDALCQPPALLFETETLAEDSARCEHGGLRVFSGHDDGDPDGVPGDGQLQDGEIELDRDVCLAATDVLVNGGTGDCTVATVGRRGHPWQAFALLLMAAVLGARRRKR